MMMLVLLLTQQLPTAAAARKKERAKLCKQHCSSSTDSTRTHLAEAEGMLAAFDLNGDGALNAEEFAAMVNFALSIELFFPLVPCSAEAA